MTYRGTLSIVAGIFAVYLLAHAAPAWYAMNQMREVLLEPERVDWPIELEARETYMFLTSAFMSTAFLSAMAFTACFSFHRGFRWAQYLWLAFSTFLLVCIGSAVFVLGATWTFYLFEIGAVTASLFLLVRVQGKQSGSDSN